MVVRRGFPGGEGVPLVVDNGKDDEMTVWQGCYISGQGPAKRFPAFLWFSGLVCKHDSLFLGRSGSQIILALLD